MDSVTDEPQLAVVVGVDAHAGANYFAVLDQRGALLASKYFAVGTSGYAQALERVDQLRPR